MTDDRGGGAVWLRVGTLAAHLNALEHSSFDRGPLWVCEAIVEDDLRGALPRTDPFAPDPELATTERSELSDCKGPRFDRDHQAQAGNQTVDRQPKDETFFLSNMAAKGELL